MMRLYQRHVPQLCRYSMIRNFSVNRGENNESGFVRPIVDSAKLLRPKQFNDYCFYQIEDSFIESALHAKLTGIYGTQVLITPLFIALGYYYWPVVAGISYVGMSILNLRRLIFIKKNKPEKKFAISMTLSKNMKTVTIVRDTTNRHSIIARVENISRKSSKLIPGPYIEKIIVDSLEVIDETNGLNLITVYRPGPVLKMKLNPFIKYHSGLFEDVVESQSDKVQKYEFVETRK